MVLVSRMAPSGSSTQSVALLSIGSGVPVGLKSSSGGASSGSSDSGIA